MSARDPNLSLTTRTWAAGLDALPSHAIDPLGGSGRPTPTIQTALTGGRL